MKQVEDLLQQITQRLRNSLDELGFNYNVRNLLIPVNGLTELLKSPQQPAMFLMHAPAHLNNLRVTLNNVLEDVERQAGRRFTIVLNTGEVSTKLKELPTTLKLNEAQTALLNEATRCLECGAYRSAAVMAWNMAFDFIRQWAFDKHISAFNTALANGHINKKTGKSVYDDIVTYDDFIDVPERIVVDCCFNAKLFGDTIRHDLVKHLRTRNAYAHPSPKVPTATKINSYVEELIDIITDAQFK